MRRQTSNLLLALVTVALAGGCFRVGGVKPGRTGEDSAAPSDDSSADDTGPACTEADRVLWYLDADGDGYGDASTSLLDCTQPTGFVLDASDCDDANAAVHPGASEVCDGLDNDCDGLLEGQDPDLADGTTWCQDADRDGYGDPTTGTYRCSQPTGSIADCSDCDDGDAAVNPAATEVCDGRDDDCDGEIDEGAACDHGFVMLDLRDDVNRDHTDGPWTDNPTESFDVTPGIHRWAVADGTPVDLEIIDPDWNDDRSIMLTKGGETWRPSYDFPEEFVIDGEGASGDRMHIAGLASGWSDPALFAGVAATLTIAFDDGTSQVVALENGVNLDDWNNTGSWLSSPDAVQVYVDWTYGRHINALTVALDSHAPIDHITLLDDASVHTGNAEKTSVAVFAITVEW